jgi:hypothetical protein
MPEGANVFVVAGFRVAGSFAELLGANFVLDDRGSSVADDLLAVDGAVLCATLARARAVAPRSGVPLRLARFFVAQLRRFGLRRGVAQTQTHGRLVVLLHATQNAGLSSFS